MRLPKLPHIAIVILIALVVLYVLHARGMALPFDTGADDVTKHPAAN